MQILIAAATEAEIAPLKDHFGNQISTLITGVGMVATAFALGRHLANHRYDLIINLGIAGSLDRSIALGQVLEITQDTFTELGAEDDTAFLSINQLGFGEDTFMATASLARLLPPGNLLLPAVAGITVNTVHGNEASISKVMQRTAAKLESMEGAAFFYACAQLHVPCLQIRAVSNYVEKRNRHNWKIGLAVKNLNTFAIELIDKLSAQDNTYPTAQ